MNAVNSHDFQYNSVTIPIRIPYKQVFAVNFEAFNYLYDHNTEEMLSLFRSDPNRFFKSFDIILGTDFDEMSANIITAILEPEIYPH